MCVCAQGVCVGVFEVCMNDVRQFFSLNQSLSHLLSPPPLFLCADADLLPTQQAPIVPFAQTAATHTQVGQGINAQLSQDVPWGGVSVALSGSCINSGLTTQQPLQHMHPEETGVGLKKSRSKS